ATQIAPLVRNADTKQAEIRKTLHTIHLFEKIPAEIVLEGSEKNQLALRSSRWPIFSFFVRRYFAAGPDDSTSIETRSTISRPASCSAFSLPGLLELTFTLHNPRSNKTSAHCR